MQRNLKRSGRIHLHFLRTEMRKCVPPKYQQKFAISNVLIHCSLFHLWPVTSGYLLPCARYLEGWWECPVTCFRQNELDKLPNINWFSELTCLNFCLNDKIALSWSADSVAEMVAPWQRGRWQVEVVKVVFYFHIALYKTYTFHFSIFSTRAILTFCFTANSLPG